MSSTMRSVLSTVVLLLAGSVAAQTATVTITSTVADQTTTVFTTSASPTFTAVSDCHPHSTVLYVRNVQAKKKKWSALTRYSWCMVGEDEYQVSGPTATEEFQEQYTSCHSHSSGT